MWNFLSHFLRNQLVDVLCAASASGPILSLPISHLYNTCFLFTDLFYFLTLMVKCEIFVTFSFTTIECSPLIFDVQPQLGVPYRAYQFHTCTSLIFFSPTWFIFWILFLNIGNEFKLLGKRECTCISVNISSQFSWVFSF